MKFPEKTAWAIAAVALPTVLVVVVYILYTHINRMKQSIKGTLGQSYFTIDELCASDTAEEKGIDNTPSEAIKAKLQALIDNVLDPTRRAYGSFIRVNSGYRCPALNTAVGGASTSQHTTGEAADITGGSVAKNREIFNTIAKLGKYDQLIWEKGGQWVHVSYRESGNRLAMLSYDGSSYTNINSTWQNAIMA